MPAVVLLAALALVAVGCAARPPEPPALADGTDRRFSHTVVTDAAPDAVWRLWTDVSTWPQWDTEVARVEMDAAWAVGARGRLVPASGPSARVRVTEVEPGRATTFETALPLGALRVARRWRAAGTPGQAAGGGRIAFTHEVSFHGVGGRLLARRLGRRFRAALPQAMARLDSLARAGAAAP